jgi:DNA-binding transcriptional MerR regulator
LSSEPNIYLFHLLIAVNLPEMGRYSIKELEKLSGIKAHTIRIWEKRYRIIQPQRTATNIRYYSDDDLKRIINVSVLNGHGVKISRIAGMSFDEIGHHILTLTSDRRSSDIDVDSLVVSMIDLDEEAFERILSNLTRLLGFQRCLTEVVYPFMEKIGVLWQTGSINPAQEHFISNLIRQTIIKSIAALPFAPKHARKVILFLPEGELHEIGLLFFHYVLRHQDFKTFYLGQSVPHRDLISIYNTHKPEVLITALTSTPSPRDVPAYIQKLSTDFKSATILVSGSLARSTAFDVPKNIRLFYKATDLTALLQQV